MRPLSALSLVLAFGACAFGQPPAPLAITVSHSGNFLQGQTNAFYLIRVSNPGLSASTGMVLVTDRVPSGLRITSLSGAGWNCSNVACWRNDDLQPGQSYPAIVALAAVDHNAPPSIRYTAIAVRNLNWSGTASDLTTIEEDSYPIGWGYNHSGQSSAPASLTNAVAVAGGLEFSLALKSDGTVVAWGYNGDGETNVPAGLKHVIAIACGSFHSLALKSDGTVAAWGANWAGQTSVPAGLTDVVAIAAGYDFSLAVKSDGTVVGWGDNSYGQAFAPGLTNVVAVAGGMFHSVALKSDGTVAAWGADWAGQTDVPAGLTNVVAIAAGWFYNLALKSDGTVVGWGSNPNGEMNVPAGLTNVVAIAAGTGHSLALKSDGSVVAWGDNTFGETNVPAGLADVFAMAGGFSNTLALASSASSAVPTTITTSDCNESIEVDGTTYGCNVLFDWTKGSSHTIATSTPQYTSSYLGGQEVQATKYTFTNWSDGGAISHSIHATTPGKTYTANFTTSNLLMTTVGPEGGGTVYPPTGWYKPGTAVTIHAIANRGSTFSGWSGDCSGTGTCKLTMDYPHFVQADFTTP